MNKPTKYKIALVTLVIILAVIGISKYIYHYKQIVIKVNELQFELGSKINEEIINSHSLSSAFTSETDDDDLILYPLKESCYEYLRILTLNDKIRSLGIRKLESDSCQIIIKVSDFFHETEIKTIGIEALNYYKLESKVMIMIYKQDGNENINIIDLDKFGRNGYTFF